jgi:hypothetical protein
MYGQGKQNSRFLLSPEHLPPETGLDLCCNRAINDCYDLSGFFPNKQFPLAILRGRIGVFALTFPCERSGIFFHGGF